MRSGSEAPATRLQWCGRVRPTTLILAATVAIATPATGQRVRGTVQQAGGTIPVPNALVVARDAFGHERARSTADGAGRFDLVLPAAGSYRLGALRVGFRLAAERVVGIAAGQTVALDLQVGIPLTALAAVEVRGQSSCSGNRAAAAQAMDYWERARVALASVDQLARGDGARATVVTFDEVVDTADNAQSVYSATRSGPAQSPFVAPDSIAALGFVRRTGGWVEYYAPDAEVLLSSAFASTHCFQADFGERAGVIRIQITPQHPGQRADVSGDLWLDAATSRLVSLEVAYTGIPEVSPRAGSVVRFTYLPSGRAVVSHWWIRMPHTWIERTLSGVGVYQRLIDHELVSSVHVTGGELTALLEGSDTVFRAPGHVFVATVRREGARGKATVELLGTAHTAPMGTDGRAVMRNVLPGTYRMRITLAEAASAPQDFVALVRGDLDTTSLSVTLRSVHMAAADTGTGTIAGSVLRGLDSLPLSDALVTVDGTNLSSRTGMDGRFRITGVPPGEHAVRAARIGYHPSVVSGVVAPGSATTTDVKLSSLPGWLNAIVINGRRYDIPPGFEDVYRRGLSGFGTFFTQTDIEREHALDVKSLIATIPGVYANDHGIQFARCRPGQHTQTRAGNVVGGNDKVQVYVNGAQVTRLNDGESTTSVHDALQSVNISAILAIEIYRGVAQIPAEFLNDACAVVAIWTKSY